MRFIGRVMVGTALLTAVFVPALGQAPTPDELKKEIEELKKGQEAIQKDLQEIKRLLQTRPQAPAAPQAPTEAVFEVGKRNFKGDPNAPVVLVEISDYQ